MRGAVLQSTFSQAMSTEWVLQSLKKRVTGKKMAFHALNCQSGAWLSELDRAGAAVL
jgi:hypothetical protein